MRKRCQRPTSAVATAVLCSLAALATIAAIAPTAIAEEGLPSAREVDPGAFEVEPSYFAERVRTIALIRTQAGPFMDAPPALIERLTRNLGEQLEAAGYEVIPPEVWDALWLEAAQAMGGAFDAKTGAPHPERHALVHEHTLRELERIHGVDAVAGASLYEQRESRIAYYLPDDPLTWQGKPLYMRPTAMRFVWVGLSIRDTNDRVLYTVSYQAGWNRVYFNQGYEDHTPLDLGGSAADALRACLYYLTGGVFPERLGKPREDWVTLGEG